MIEVYTVSLFGHRLIENMIEVEKAIERIVEKITLSHDFTVFLVGCEGDFDRIATSVIHRAKKLRDNISLILVLPYPKSEYIRNCESYNKFYDDVEIYSSLEKVHPKAAYQIRNRYMVDRSDEVIFYVKDKIGGAAKTLRYAENKGKKIINVGQ